MVKTPRTRHSGKQRDPLTIDLDADAVSRVEEAGPDLAASTDAEQAETVASLSDAPLVGTESAAAEPLPGDQSEAEAGPDVAASADTDAPAYAYDDFEAARDQSGYGQPDDGGSYAPAEPEPFAKAEPKRSGLSSLAAGLIGGAVVLAGGGILQYTGLLGSPDPVAGAPALNGVNAEIEALRSEIATLRDTPAAPGGDDGRIDGFGQSLEQVQSEITSLREALASGGSGDAGLATRVAELETATAGQSGAASAEEIAAINERLAGLDALVKAAGEAGTAVDGRLGAIEQGLAALTAKVDAQTAQPKIALAIAASALKSAIERGSPFQSEIETFAAIVPNAPELPALRAHAATGVASEADIAAEADAVAEAIIAASTPVSQNAGFLERLMDSAGSMVSVRPVGAVEGAGVPETVARMEVAIEKGDLPAALAEFDSLPEAARTAGASFGDKLRARVDAEKLIDQAIAAAMQAA